MRSIHTAEFAAVLSVMVAARKRAGLTQQQLARRLERPQSFVSKYESGERRLDVVEFLWILRVLKADPGRSIRKILAAAKVARREPSRGR